MESGNPILDDIMSPITEVKKLQGEIAEDELLLPPTHGFSHEKKARNRARNRMARASRKAQRARAKGK